MQLEQTGVARIVSKRTGTTNDGKPYYRLTVADEEMQVLQVYCNAIVYNKCAELEFGHEVQLVFKMDQWRSGLHVECVDVSVLSEKKR